MFKSTLPRSREPMIDAALGIVGGTVGGLLGQWAFFWIAGQGFYALVLPGAMVGFGCGLVLQRRSIPVMVICGLGGLFLGILTEWKFAPFVKDQSLGYFLTHLHDLKPITLVMILLGGLLAAFLGRGRAA